MHLFLCLRNSVLRDLFFNFFFLIKMKKKSVQFVYSFLADFSIFLLSILSWIYFLFIWFPMIIFVRRIEITSNEFYSVNFSAFSLFYHCKFFSARYIFFFWVIYDLIFRICVRISIFFFYTTIIKRALHKTTRLWWRLYPAVFSRLETLKRK